MASLARALKRELRKTRRLAHDQAMMVQHFTGILKSRCSSSCKTMRSAASTIDMKAGAWQTVSLLSSSSVSSSSSSSSSSVCCARSLGSLGLRWVFWLWLWTICLSLSLSLILFPPLLYQTAACKLLSLRAFLTWSAICLKRWQARAMRWIAVERFTPFICFRYVAATSSTCAPAFYWLQVSNPYALA